MANKYVSNLRGNDTTGSGTATSPVATIGKLIASGGLASAGDFVYIEPSPTPYREQVILGITPSSGSPLSIIGDVDGAGFAAGGYSTPATGIVDWRGWSDEFTPMTSATLSMNNQPYVTLQGLKILGGTFANGGCLSVSGASNNLTIQDCIFASYVSSAAVQIAMPFSSGAWNLTIQRCDFEFGSIAGLNLRPQLNSTEYDINVLVRNCRSIGRGDGFYITPSGGSGTGLAKGVTFQNCGAFWCTNGFRIYSTTSNTMTVPVSIQNCRSLYCTTGLLANNTSQVSNDYNGHHSTNDVSGVTAGSHSKPMIAPALDFGDARLTGLPYRPFGEPSVTSGFGGFGTGVTPPTVDFSNRARPEGFGSTSVSCGEMERHDTGTQNTSAKDTGSAAALQLTGPASQDRPVLVDATAATLSVKVRWDGNHGDTNKPQAMILANPEIGVAGQTVTATSTGGSGSTLNSFETLTFSSITPTAKGVVMLRFVSRAAAGNGAAVFDTIGIA